MRYKDLSAILPKLDLLSNNVPQKLVYLNLEAELALEAFLSMQRRINKPELANQEVSEADWEAFKALLAQRWQRIQNTNASYTVNPDTTANLAYVALAKAISKHTAETEKIYTPWLLLLIPTLTREEAQRYDTTNFHGLVMSDDNDRFIGVRESFKLAAIKPGLTATEEYRVTHYSRGAKYYTSVIDNKGSLSALVAARYHLDDILERDAYVNAYGEEGKSRLQTNVLASADKIITTKDQLLALLTTKTNDRTHWQPILDSLSLAHLQNLLFEHHDSLAQSLSNLSLSDNDAKNSALAFCYLSLYCKQRSVGYESGVGFLSATAKTIPALFGLVSTKTDKMDAVQSVMNLLIEGESLPTLASAIDAKLNVKQQEALHSGSVKSIIDKLIAQPVVLVPEKTATVLHV